VIEYFNSLGVKKPELVAPFVGSWECFGGLFIILGLMSRICGGALAVVMTVAILSAKLSDVDSLQSLLGFEETAYFGIFTWLAICGAGKASLDHILEQRADESRE
jgi:putative oxidoreductase